MILTFNEIKDTVKPKLIINIKNNMFSKVTINSKEINNGDVFVALKGVHKDGHTFINEAFKNGASLCIAERQIGNVPQLIVDDTNRALKNIASLIRSKFHGSVVAVVGSTGKTTIKELIYSILSTNTVVHKSKDNENNWIGVSKTLITLDEKCKVCVAECGTNHPFEMYEIAKILKPNIVLFTNISFTHIGNFLSINELVKEKMSILKDNPIKFVVYNMDDELLKFEHYHSYKYSLNNHSADAYIENFHESKGNIYMNLKILNERLKVTLKNIFINKYNVIGAITLSKILLPHLSEYDLENAINGAQIPNFRMQQERLYDTHFILDCYNSSPAALKYAIQTVSRLHGKKLLILGDMLELGDASLDLHKEIGIFLKNFNMDIITYGHFSYYMIDNLKERKFCKHYSDKDELISLLSNIYKNYSYILIKGSRTLKMEDIFYKLKKQVS